MEFDAFSYVYFSLVTANVLLIWATRKRTKLIKGYVTSASVNPDDLNNQGEFSINVIAY